MKRPKHGSKAWDLYADQQAAEIERLEEELKTARAIYDGSLELILEQEAQLATMRAALKASHNSLNHAKVLIGPDGPDFQYTVGLIDKALTTDAGKAAADVLAAVGEWAKHEDAMSANRAVGVLKAWEAYRKEGQDDG